MNVDTAAVDDERSVDNTTQLYFKYSLAQRAPVVWV